MTENLKEGGVVNKPITNTLNTQEEIFNTKINKNNFSFCFETLLNYSLIKMDYNCSCNKKLEELNLKKEKITKFFKKVKNIIPLEKMEEEIKRENVFKNKNYCLVFLGALVSNIASLFYSFAVSFYILKITDNNALLQGIVIY